MGIVISNYYGGTAKALARALGPKWKVTMADANRQRRVPKAAINFGTTAPLRFLARGHREVMHALDFPLLNNPRSVINAVDKLRTLTVLQAAEIPCLTFTADPAVARTWLPEGRSVVCRLTTTGHGGQGIDILKWGDWKAAGKPAVPAFPDGVKLFTKYFPKQEEVRVHVFRGEVIDYSKKMRARGDEPNDIQKYVRSHANGWIFGREGVVRNEAACAAGIAAVKALGLDFGAVDIGIGKDGVAVFEVNSAPGMEGTTLAAYAAAFQKAFG